MSRTTQCTTTNWRKSNEKDWDVDCTFSRNVSRLCDNVVNEEYKQDLDKVFNTLANTAEMDKLVFDLSQKQDPNHRGYVDLETLVESVNDIVSDKRTALTLTTLMAENLEYKNSDCVFYSSLLGLPPPYFKYGYEIDNFDLVAKLNAECKQLDSHQQGFVPTSLFKSLCEKLRIKVKISEDFVDQCAANMVDVNVTSNGLNVGLIDYVVLVRKLMKSLPKVRQVEHNITK